MKIEIKTLFGSVLFEYDCEENTILKTLIKAVEGKKDLTGADLTGANLRGADLGGAYLGGAYLTGANLTGAYLTVAYLRGADLTGANLREVDLRGANLTGANLTEADLRGANLTGANLTEVDLGGKKITKGIVFTGLYKYIVIPYITEKHEKRVKMGCHDRSVTEWDADFWNNNREFPNNGDEDSKLRLMAFEAAKRWFEIIK